MDKFNRKEKFKETKEYLDKQLRTHNVAFDIIESLENIIDEFKLKVIKYHHSTSVNLYCTKHTNKRLSVIFEKILNLYNLECCIFRSYEFYGYLFDLQGCTEPIMVSLEPYDGDLSK